MHLSSLYLRDFRSHEEAWVEFGPRLNNIYGPNAQGKTNLLEAIYFLIIGRSFRTQGISDLVRYEANSFFLEARFVKNGIEQTLRVSTDGKEKNIVYNSTKYSSFTNLLGLLQGVVLTPQDNTLVSGSPVLRRRYLDIQIAQVDPLYVHHLSRYTRAMKQRNTLLRRKKTTAIETWELEMAKAAAYITKERSRTIKDLSEKAGQIQLSLSKGNDLLGMRYKTTAPVKSEKKDVYEYFLEQYQKLRNREMILGYTTTGPHRDDMTITIHEKDARLYASEGQKCCCAVSLRLAEWQRLNEISGEAPLMAIDDIGSSLDKSRKEAIGQYLSELGQVFVTSTERLPTMDSHLIEISGLLNAV